MDVKSFVFEPIKSKMYIMVEEGQALIIDPNISDYAKEYLDSNGVKDILIILTHEHCDHCTGVNWLKENYNTQVLCSKECASAICDSHKNLSSFFRILIEEKDWNYDMEPFTCNADMTFENEMNYVWQSHNLFLKETPGHSKGSICILLDGTIFFTGDSFIPNVKVITKLPGGSKREYESKTKPYLKTVIDSNINVYAGH